jgi:hypothetical protein
VALDGATPAVGDGLPRGLGRSPWYLPAERTDGEARQQRRTGQEGAGRGERGNADAGPEHRDRHQPGGDEPAPPGDLDPLPGQAEQRRQQGQGADHGHQDRDRRAETDPGHQPDPHEQHAEQRDHHRDPGEDHRSPGRAHGRHGRGPRWQARAGAFPVTGDDEQRVVDAHAETDHGPHAQREVGDGVEVAEQERQPDPHPDATQRDGHRQSHGEDRAEGQHQDDHRERQPDQLGLQRLDGSERPTAGNHLQARQ